MLKILFIVFPFFWKASEDKNIDFIICIDENILIAFTTIKFEGYNPQGMLESYLGEYYPGNLKINDLELHKISKLTSLKITINTNEYFKDTKKNKEYVIDYNATWLNEYFNVINIYNLDKKEYKKKFKGIKTGKSFVFELDSPDSTFKILVGK